MPRGLYSLRPRVGAVVAYERFSCAPDPAGWRYNAQVLAPDGSRRRHDRRVRAAGGGGVGGETVWVRTGASGEDVGEDTARAAALAGRFPGFLVAVARLVGLRPGASSRIRLVALTDPALAPLTVDVAWSLTTLEASDRGRSAAGRAGTRPRTLASGQRAIVHVVGDVVLAAPGIELETLDTPPTLPSGRSF